MKYKLPRQILDEKLDKIISREARRQKVAIPAISKGKLKEMSKICREIKKEGLPSHLVCKRLPRGLGFGIFLHPKAKPLVKGQIIAAYAGEVSLIPQNEPDNSLYAFAILTDILLTKEEQRLLDSKRRYHPRRLYLLNLDALKKGNFTRFINHSEKPNVIALLYKTPKNPYGLVPSAVEVIYLVKKTIHPGEQLLVSYEEEEKSYWDVLKIRPIPITPQTFTLSSSLKVQSADAQFYGHFLKE
ncbi:MAG: SET domain-containing protein-lysine N-methyltransferase [Anaerolineae bacterium]